ncbi:hypothetical protein BR93DRAFT_269128 [Coniochaeta sp. PMI_546]|nr:hypothetical protein BR93DRAFT_269128 [Coniochaeta sp. PMI_546]
MLRVRMSGLGTKPLVPICGVVRKYCSWCTSGWSTSAHGFCTQDIFLGDSSNTTGRWKDVGAEAVISIPEAAQERILPCMTPSRSCLSRHTRASLLPKEPSMIRSWIPAMTPRRECSFCLGHRRLVLMERRPMTRPIKRQSLHGLAASTPWMFLVIPDSLLRLRCLVPWVWSV